MEDRLLSKGTYLALISAIVASGFLIIFATSLLLGDQTASRAIPASDLLVPIVLSIAVLIVGCYILWRGKMIKSAKLCLVGFYIVSIVLGLPTGLLLPMFGLNTIAAAAAGTMLIVAIFGFAGFLFPHFFAKIQGICTTGLFGIIAVELVYLFLNVHQTWTDWVAIVIFCGFIGYDFYQAVHAERTKANAILFATEIYLDIINVFLSLLSIFDRD